MAERTATARLSRLLALVPYVLTHQGISFAEAAKEFAISESQLKDDLNLIFVSGLPGYTPLELIDVVMDHDTIHIRNAEVISKPMRLAPDEALALLVGLQLIEEMASEEIATLKAKLSEAALLPLIEVAERFAVIDQPAGPLIQDALSRQRRLLIDYYVPSRDEITVREIDPLGVEVIEGHTYLRAFCRSADALRHFRLDRIIAAKIVDRPISPPPAVIHSELGFGVPPGQPEVQIRIASSARWLIDHLNGRVMSEEPLVISADLGNRDFFIRLALSMADQIQVMAPQDLCLAIGEAAKRGLERYESS